VIFNKPFGRYRLVKKLAMGGMAEVYLALRSGPRTFDKLVAIKCILPHVNSDAAHVAMFYNEARIGGLFRHANLISVHDAEEIETRHSLVMEYVAGQTLEEVVNRVEQGKDTLPLDYALFIMAEAARGLAHAHSVRDLDGARLDLVHRDISPQNIMVAHDGRVKVFDFGLAVAAANDTETRELAGKTAYMSPEQVRGRALDNRSDLFSLGIVLHELVTGQRLFQRENQMSTIVAVTEEQIPKPSSIRPELPAYIDEVVMRCLARPVDDRFDDCDVLADALDSVLIQLNSDVNGERLGTWMQRKFSNEIGEIEAVIQKVLQAPERSEATIDLSTFDSKVTRTTSPIPAIPPVRGIAREEGKGLETLGANEPVDLPPPPRVESMIPSEASAALLDQLQKARRTSRILAVLAGVLAVSVGVVLAIAPLLKDDPVVVTTTVDNTAPVATPAFIVLTSDPSGAAISLNGQDTGRVTPAQLQAIPGQEASVSLTADGFLPVSLTVTPTVDAPAVVAATLQRDPNATANMSGSIRVTYEPADAVLTVDGTAYPGPSPVQVDGLSLFEEHELRIEKLGFETATDSFTLENADTMNVQFALLAAQEVGVVNIRSNPVGAEIVINGEIVGVTPLEGLQLVADQEYQIVLQRDGARWRTRLTLDPDSVQNIDATLQRDRPVAPATPRPVSNPTPVAETPPAAEPPRQQPSYQLLD
jgi:eukaryotic-like serine/threonine-protein kinase